MADRTSARIFGDTIAILAKLFIEADLAIQKAAIESHTVDDCRLIWDPRPGVERP
ncbi:MAG: hypothetical protein ABIL09_13010 [Gemmatimonadota bacterium]